MGHGGRIFHEEDGALRQFAAEFAHMLPVVEADAEDRPGLDRGQQFPDVHPPAAVPQTAERVALQEMDGVVGRQIAAITNLLRRGR